MVALKITRIGNSAGLVLPKEALAKLRVGQGDTVYLTEAPDGYRITPYDPEFARQMALGRKIMRTHRNALRELAK
ncbi:MAG TPA: AbrB/MazE/SpoVT family DNA-binding domain-containing protein [Stellaceae bacterium]|nr:AbrB/MazE/SpoVT family DNA-binding domain-containing protein [Stellaceae bacterium]